jgi:hypothetical protein
MGEPADLDKELIGEDADSGLGEAHQLEHNHGAIAPEHQRPRLQFRSHAPAGAGSGVVLANPLQAQSGRGRRKAPS